MPYRYQNTQITKVNNVGEQYYLNTIYPDIPITEGDNYVITVSGDRLDILANNFYGNTDYWWIIATANSLPGDSLYIEPGTQLRIPTNIQAIVNLYRITNSKR
jgi:hypothetical protein